MIGLLLGNWRTIAISAALAGVMAGGGVWWLRDLMAAHDRLRATEHVVHVQQRQAQTTERVVTRYVQGAERIRTVTQTINREIPVVLPPQVDVRFALPRGLVRLHDDAARGVSSLPDSSGGPDAEASPVTPSLFAGAITDNYGSCHETAARLEALQDWVTAQAAIR